MDPSQVVCNPLDRIVSQVQEIAGFREAPLPSDAIGRFVPGRAERKREAKVEANGAQVASTFGAAMSRSLGVHPPRLLWGSCQYGATPEPRVGFDHSERSSPRSSTTKRAKRPCVGHSSTAGGTEIRYRD